MNDIRETLGEDGTGSGGGDAASTRAAGRKRCCQRSPRKKRDETIVLTTAVLCCFWPMFFAAGGSKGKHAAEVKVPAVAVAGGGGSETTVAGGSGAAAEAREKMEVDGSKMVKISLLYSAKTKLPGADDSSGTLAVAFDIEKDWHTYWRNSGDTGMPPTFEFTVDPPGALEIGEAHWPVPERHMSEGDILDYIYERRVLHLFEVRSGKAPVVNKGDVTITCKASWLVCKEACLPGEGSAKTTIQTTNREQPQTDADREIAQVRGSIPLPAKLAEDKFRYEWNGNALSIVPTNLAASDPDTLRFFPFSDEQDAVPNNLFRGAGSRGAPPGTLQLQFDADNLNGIKRVRGVVAPVPTKGLAKPGSPVETKAYTVDIPTPRPPE